MTDFQAGPAQPVYIIDSSQLVENGGTFLVSGRRAIAITGISPSGGGIPEPVGDGLWARFVASTVGSWLQATTVGAALFAAVDAAAARLAIGAMPVVAPAVAGNLVVQAADGTLVNAGYAAVVAAAGGSVTRRGAGGEVAGASDYYNAIAGNSTSGNGVYGTTEDGTAVKGVATSPGGRGGEFTALSTALAATSSGGDYHAAWGDESRIMRLTGILAFLGANAAANRIAQLAELGAAALAANTFTGDQNLNGNQIYGYRVREVVANVTGTYTVNLLTANLFVLTVTGNVVIDFSNAPATPGAASVTVILIQGGAGGFTVAFTGAKWANGTAPTLNVAAGVETDLSFIVRNSGADIRGYLAAEDMS